MASGATRGTVRGDFVEVTLMLVCVLLVGISACFLGWFLGYVRPSIFMDFQTVSNLFSF